MNTNFKMLPVEECKIAIIVNLRYMREGKHRRARGCIFLPFEYPGIEHKALEHGIEVIKDSIHRALKEYGYDTEVFVKNILFDTVKNDLSTVFNGGRPSKKIIIRMIPDIPSGDYMKYSETVFVAHDYSITFYLDILSKDSECLEETMIYSYFPIDETESIKWGAVNMVSL
jgi:hypothetical protein